MTMLTDKKYTDEEILIEANTILNGLDKLEQKLRDNSIKDNVLLEMLLNVRDIMEEFKIEIINYTNAVIVKELKDTKGGQTNV